MDDGTTSIAAPGPSSSTVLSVGCVFRPQFPPETLAAAARAADNAGLHELWLWEDCFLNGGVSAAAIALANSERLRVGLGVLPVPMRNVAVTAMEIATLDRMFPGRLRVGIGHGVQEWMAQIGERVASPMTLLREYTSVLAALLRGETVSHDGRYVTVADVRLDWPPAPDVELLLAATGPRTLELSGELGSGTVITGGTSPDGLRQAVHHIRRGMAKRAQPARHSTVVYVICAVDPDAAGQIGDELAYWKLDGGHDVAAYGTPAEIAAAATRWIDAGADTIVFQPSGSVDIEEFVEIIGTRVQPLLTGQGRPPATGLSGSSAPAESRSP